MITLTSAEAQNRFGELLDRAQREPVEVTRRGRTVAYVLSEADMQEVVSLRRRREQAATWYAHYRKTVAEAASEQAGTANAASLTDADINDLVHEFR
jgi:antitoxin Phd